MKKKSKRSISKSIGNPAVLAWIAKKEDGWRITKAIIEHSLSRSNDEPGEKIISLKTACESLLVESSKLRENISRHRRYLIQFVALVEHAEAFSIDFFYSPWGEFVADEVEARAYSGIKNKAKFAPRKLITFEFLESLNSKYDSYDNFCNYWDSLSETRKAGLKMPSSAAYSRYKTAHKKSPRD
jgi:hypothetical protein